MVVRNLLSWRGSNPYETILLLGATVVLAGCTRPGDYPISSNCLWNEKDSRSVELTKYSDRRHLRFDAVTAEDAAIRWADKYFGLAPEYDQRRRECMELLFQGVAKQHGVDVATVRQYSRERDVVIDAATFLSFGTLYAVGAYIFAGRIHRRFQRTSPAFG